MPRIVVLDPLAREGLDILIRGGLEYEVRTGLKGDDLRRTLAEFDGAILRSGVKITAESLTGNKRLRAIVRAGVGTDNIDKTAATRCGIVVMNTPAGNTLSTAEHALALMLALARNVAPAHQSLVEGRWDRSKFMGAQLADKVLGVIGLGRIGQAVAERANAFDMRVVGFDPFLSKERAHELGVEVFPTVAELLPLVDFLTVHTPLTPETQNLIGAKEIEAMKPGVRLINCARGGIYNEPALIEGLKSGRLGGVALDVFETEPCTKSPLFGMPNVVCTPHLGASTEEAQTQVAIEGAGLLVDFFTSGSVRHAVNMAAIDPQKLLAVRGFLDVGHRLGRLVAQLECGPARACRLTYRGEVAQRETKLITSAFAAGLLQGALDEEVNLVNAETLLRERGIELVEQSRSDLGAFSSIVTAELEGEHGAVRVAGTLLGQQMVRLVQIDDFRLEAYLDGVLLVFRHRDVPGIIGRVGTIFGRHSVNIAQMSVGRATRGGLAIGVLNLDSRPPQAALDEMTDGPDIHNATVVELPDSGELPAWLRA